MRRLECPNCGQRVFFENFRCIACGREFGFDPVELRMALLDPDRIACAQRRGPVSCNWLLARGEPGPLCRSCRLTRTLPDLSAQGSAERLRVIEQDKRRLLHGLIRLGLGAVARDMRFDILADPQAMAGGPPTIPMGHQDDLITLNLAEADPGYRERTRTELDESYRTVLGHLRHESGHYFWSRLVAANAGRLTRFRALFGDERSDYGVALARHYARAGTGFDHERFVSAYAGSHPVEDWAESWAHLLHVLDTLESARSMHLLDDETGHPMPDPYAEQDMRVLLQRFRRLTLLLNELNRALGLADAYPFVLGDGVVAKLAFIHDIVQVRREPAGDVADPSPANPGAGRP